MAAATVSYLGQANGTGDTDALFLKVFAGEVLAAFGRSNVMNGRHMVKTITAGKSAQFPATWQATAAYHTAGAEIAGTAIKHNERVIAIDGMLIAPTFIAEIDEAMNHYDVRSLYSIECGRALGKKYDENVLASAVLASRASATITNGATPGGKQTDTNYTSATLATAAEALAAGIFTAASTLDSNDIPAEDRYAIFRPAQYYTLVQSAKAVNRDWGGSGSYSDGNVLRIAGIEILSSNNLPSTNTTSGTNIDKYEGDFSETVGLVMHKSAVGTVKLLDLALEMDYDIRRQGTLLVAKYAVGHGILRPECAVEFDDT